MLAIEDTFNVDLKCERRNMTFSFVTFLPASLFLFYLFLRDPTLCANKLARDSRIEETKFSYY